MQKSSVKQVKKKQKDTKLTKQEKVLLALRIFIVTGIVVVIGLIFFYYVPVVNKYAPSLIGYSEVQPKCISRVSLSEYFKYKKQLETGTEESFNVYDEGCNDASDYSDYFNLPIPQALKPVIYIYPGDPTEVFVKLSNPEKLTTTYPKYHDGWRVLAQPNGDLKEINKSRTYYGLYWEGKNTVEPDFTNGFVVPKAGLVPFLEDKLDVLGLNEREANEFIIYWLPILEQADYQAIRFLTQEENNHIMELSITPKPDTIIRVMMQFKPVDKDYVLPEQHLNKVVRKGFTVVEWGGLKENNLK